MKEGHRCYLCKKLLVREIGCKHQKAHVIHGHFICNRCLYPKIGRMNWKHKREIGDKIMVEEIRRGIKK